MCLFLVSHFIQVGGAFFIAALNQMRPGGRIAVCGAISLYNATTPQMCKRVL